MAVAQSSSGGVAICYVLPVLWVTSRLVVVGGMAMRCDTEAESEVYECLVLFYCKCSEPVTGLLTDYDDSCLNIKTR